MEKQEIIEGILYFLRETAPSFDGAGYTFLQIIEFLKLNNIWNYFEEKGDAWNNLRMLLIEMENEGLIEERHFDESLGGRVDYSIENKGLEALNRKENLSKKMWKIPESD